MSRSLTIAEWVLPGHPDKLCDALADRCVGEVLKTDPHGQCGIEAGCAFGHVFVTGLLGFMLQRRPQAQEQVAQWVRETYASAGYGGRWDPLPQSLEVHLEALRFESRQEEWQALRHLSDDQAICVGYAQATPETGYLPGAHWLARALAMQLHAQQQADPQGDIGPDGKVIVRGEEQTDGRFRVTGVSMSLHHAEDADWLALRRHADTALRSVMGDAPLPELELNGAGMFVCGGPTGDNGSTGKKLVMDAYGPTVPIGGGAWCGKDVHKPDRAGGLLARRMALECVELGLGGRVRVQLEYRPNSPAPASVQVWADGRAAPLPKSVKIASTKEVAQAVLAGLAEKEFVPLLEGEWARWGHFGRGRTWWEPYEISLSVPDKVKL